MTVFFLVVFSLYFMGLMALLAGWIRADQPASAIQLTFGQPRQKITVIVPFRNEINTIHNLIDDLRRQDSPEGTFEAIFVDDHSIDGSFERVSKLISNTPGFLCIQLPEGQNGKKRAISYAVGMAGGKIILSTDADCRVPRAWVRSMQDRFNDPSVKMVIGGVRVAGGGTFFSELQSVEFCSLIGAAAATASFGIPILCNAASLGYHRNAFVEVDGYEGNFTVASGDDEFLLSKIRVRFPGSIVFLSDPQAVVETGAAHTVRAFMNQRLRWAGKWRFNPSVIAQLTAVAVLASQMLLVFAWFVLPWIERDTITDIIIVAGTVSKLVVDYIFLSRVAEFLAVRIRLSAFAGLQLLYPFYVIFVGLTSLIIVPQWKGRSGR